MGSGRERGKLEQGRRLAKAGSVLPFPSSPSYRSPWILLGCLESAMRFPVGSGAKAAKPLQPTSFSLAYKPSCSFLLLPIAVAQNSPDGAMSKTTQSINQSINQSAIGLSLFGVVSVRRTTPTKTRTALNLAYVVTSTRVKRYLFESRMAQLYQKAFL